MTDKKGEQRHGKEVRVGWKRHTWVGGGADDDKARSAVQIFTGNFFQLFSTSTPKQFPKFFYLRRAQIIGGGKPPSPWKKKSLGLGVPKQCVGGGHVKFSVKSLVTFLWQIFSTSTTKNHPKFFRLRRKKNHWEGGRGERPPNPPSPRKKKPYPLLPKNFHLRGGGVSMYGWEGVKCSSSKEREHACPMCRVRDSGAQNFKVPPSGICQTITHVQGGLVQGKWKK